MDQNLLAALQELQRVDKSIQEETTAIEALISQIQESKATLTGLREERTSLVKYVEERKQDLRAIASIIKGFLGEEESPEEEEFEEDQDSEDIDPSDRD